MRSRCALVLVGLLTVLSGCGDPEIPGPQEEPSHKVSYSISASGTANESLNITYVGPDGSNVETTSPGSVPSWGTEVTTKPGLTFLSLTGQANSSDLSYRLTCTITVDGVQVADNRAPYSCSASFELSKLPAILASRSPSAAPSPTPSAPALPSAPATSAAPSKPAGCRFVKGDELTEIVNDLAHVDKPVQNMAGNQNRCTYTVDYDATRVITTWKPDGKPEFQFPPPVSGLGVTAWWFEHSDFGVLDVELPDGVFTVRVEARALDIDYKDFAIAIFKAAKPRLPR
ncbi:hypothetical protein [Plantactinospora sonchi]|uniref:Uncharacterized protein n=1 Tax=Plantactinospora sonchi TaxID=1544735 RepID=A0ABU7RXT3_9ACTN